MNKMKPEDTIVITGGGGLVGNALTAFLRDTGYTNVVSLRSADGDLTDWAAAREVFARLAPAYVFHLAARVYGIRGNMENKGVSFRDNVLINTNVVEACRLCGVRKIVAMGSGCVYPYPSPGLPLKEDMVWQGKPHESEDSYAHAKRAMLAQLIAYREQYGMPYAFVISANLYGPHDKFDVEHGHVTPSLVRKFFEAKRSGGRVSVWGNGSARRDFIYASDVAAALVAIMEAVDGPVNMGSGNVHSIREIVDALADITGLADRVDWDASKPNGQDYREYDLSTLHGTGFRPVVPLPEGLALTYAWYQESYSQARH
jgi:GDP-L-fucose synthase